MDCMPAECDEIRAYWAGDHVLMVARGSHPESCWGAQLQRSPLTVWPPEFLLSRCRTANICLKVVTPFVITEEFALNTQPAMVVVHHAGGKEDVPVQPIPTTAQSVSIGALGAESEAGEGEIRVTATSLTSFAEAIELAFRKIASDGPEGLTAAQVERQWITRGGFVGVNQYHVGLLQLPSEIRPTA